MSATDERHLGNTDSKESRTQTLPTVDVEDQSAEEKRRTVESYIEHKREQTATDKQEVDSFVIAEGFKNTEDNRHREATVTVPFLVRKTASRNLVPSPWRSITQLIVVSYVSVLFCVVTGAFANHYAWKAMRCRELGLLSESKKFAASSACCIYISFAIGAVLLVVIPPVVCCVILSMC
ncbi:uncharacterized protein LOC121372236 [Gigantopelta aegis]|uniref:uncharacterized protein LOC121372236 n=1 Tax=Gigantopelta aegis TaxID=1735272 RepID=UPI001B88D905|nr:uncharacterized protein LOC121372236 [Gigantopelta aegis]